MRRMLRPIRVAVAGTCLFIATALTAAPSMAAPAAGAETRRPWMNAALAPEARAELLLARMTLAEKVGQMTQAERGAVSGDPSLVTTWMLGSLLSGGGSVPTPNTPEAWAARIDALVGHQPFTGRLSQTWPRSLEQEPINIGDRDYHPLYPYGWGLRTRARR